MGYKVDFLPADKHKKFFYKLIVSLRLCVTSHAKSTQDNKFIISLQYLKENMKNEVEFLTTDKRQRFLQSDAIILDLCGQQC